MIKAIRPFIRKFHSSEYINALAGGDICLASATRATCCRRATARPRRPEPRDIAYAVPNQGAMLWIDTVAIPKDAPNPDAAHRFLDFMLEPKVAAASSTLTRYANANVPATALLDKSITQNPVDLSAADDRARALHHLRRPTPSRPASARGCGPRSRPAARLRR